MRVKVISTLGVILLISFLWGFAEATLFFIVPDVLLTAIAIYSFRKACIAAVVAVVGALIGGIVMYIVASNDSIQADKLLLAVPWVSPVLINKVIGQYQSYSYWAVIIGGFMGIPYKIYACYAAINHLFLPLFLFVSIVARGLRFYLVILLTAEFAKLFKPYWGIKGMYILWVVLFFILYSIYWTILPF